MKNTVHISSLNSPIQRRSSGLISQIIRAFIKEAGKGENHILRVERFVWVKKMSFLTFTLALCLNGWGQPGNYICSSATSLPCGANLTSQTTSGTFGNQQLFGSTYTSAYGVYYTFTGNGAATTITATPSGWDCEMLVYSASSSCSGFTYVTNKDAGATGGAESYSFTPTNGVLYYVWIAHCNTTSTATGSFSITRSTCSSTVTLASNTISAATICPSSTKVPLQSFSLAVTVANGNLTNVGFTTTGTYQQADITRYQLWYGTTNSLASATQLGTDLSSTGAAGARTFAAFTSPTLSSGTTYYFWITADITSGAVGGRTIAVSAISTSNLTSTSTKAGSTTSAGGTQTVGSAPSISSGPTASAAACVGGTLNVSVSASGTAPLSYSWERFLSSAYSTVTSSMDGANTYTNFTTNTMNVSAVNTSMNGRQFRCVVSNSCGTVNSGLVTITVNAAPTLTSTSASTTALCVGGTATITLNGLLASTAHTITYSIGATTGLTASVTSNASGIGTFTVTPTVAQSGALVTITGITRTDVTPNCSLTPSSGHTATLPTVNPLPTVGVMPSAACLGATITIPGTNFTAGTGNTVTFTGATGVASLAATASTSLQVTIPASATTGAITISNTNGCSVTTASYTVNPTVTSPSAITVSGTEPTCQLTSSGTTTDYNSSATVGTLSWSLTGITNTAGTLLSSAINSTTGVVTWPNGWAGSVTINVVSTGCNGPTAAVTRAVTVNANPTLSYTGSPFSYTAGTAITSLIPTTTATAFSVSPSLPGGLSLNTSNGQISGTPNTPQASASYTITGTNTNGCTITTAISIGVRPANFQCATATNLACATSNLAGTTVGTTGVAHGISGTCLWSGAVSNYGVWYSFTGDGGSTTITVDPEATLDIELDIMSGSCGSYTCVDDNDGGGDGAPETITFTTVSGTNYYVYVAQFSSAGSAADVGTFTISRTCVSPPANDACSAATNLPCATSNLAGTTVGSADETPPASVATSAKGVWYAFTGNGQITTISSTGATGFDHEQTILTGSSCGSFTIVGSTQDASGSAGTETQTLLTTNGQQYYVWIAYYTSGTTTGTFTISRTCSNPVANDACANAITLTVGSAATAGTFVGDSPSDGTYDDAGYPDVWYKFTPTCDGSYQVALTNSSFDADIYLYTDCSSTTNLLSGGSTSANNETGTATLTGGTTYYIRVVDFAQQSSTFSIAVSALSTTNTAPSAITGSSSVCASTAGLTYSVTNVPGNTYNWTLPSGFTQTAGGTTNSITVTAGATSGTISVTATNSCGTSSSSALAITILSAPASVSAGSSSSICLGESVSLSGSGQSSTSSAGIIGTGTSTTLNSPVNTYLDYNYTQNLYMQSEISTAGLVNGSSITAVQFYWTGNGNMTNSGIWQILLGNTTKTNFTSTTDWIASTSLTSCYNGTVSLPAAAGWITITLTTPFTYNGNGLVVAVKEEVVSFGAINTAYQSTTQADNKTLYFNGLSNPSLSSPAAGIRTTNRPNLRLSYTSSSTPTWAWTSSPSGFTSSLQSPSATPAETTTYTLTATSGAGCTSTASVTITVNQPSVSAINTATGQTLAANDYVWDGSSNTAWTNASNWYVFNGGSSFSVATSDPSTSTNVFIVPSTISCISSTNSPTLSGANDAIASMNVASGASFTNASGSTLSISGNLTNGGTITNSGTLSLTGSLSNSGSLTSAGTMNVATGWVNNGTFTASTGSVVFNGTTSSNISGSNTFYNLTMAKTSGATATISNDITVSNLLTLTTGNIITGTNTVIVSNSSATAISGGGTGSYVRGRLRRAVATGAGGTNVSYVFPIGQSLYEEATLRFATPYSSSTSITAFFTDDNTVNSTLPAGLTQSGTPLTAILNKGYWSIDPVSVPSTPAYTVTLKSIGHMNGATSPTQYTVIKRPNSPLGAWITSEGTHSNTTQADDGTTVTAVRSGLSNFSDFAIAYGGGALPIELTTFQANCSDNNTVDVTWTTASEHNTNYFRVDKSRNGTQWDVLGTIGAAGNSTYSIDYALTDAFPQPGINYYRLTQYDLDGVFETFDAQAAVCSEQQAGTALSTYPNPSSSDFNVDLQTDEMEGEGVLLVTDAKGAVVYSQNITIINGTNNYIIQRFEAEPGIYYISVKAGANTVTTKHSLR